MQRADTPAKKKEKTKKDKVVVLNFALDPRSTSAKVKQSLFTMAASFGEFKENSLVFNLVELSEKISNNKFYLYELEHPKGMLTKGEQKDLETYQALKKAIQNSGQIIIIGHCNKNQEFLSSENKIQTTPDVIARMLPIEMTNKNIDIIACKGNQFGAALANTLLEKSQTTQLKCDGTTLSSKTHTTMLLPNGGKLYFKMSKNGFPKAFKVDENYRKDFLIKNGAVINQNISNKKEKNAFQDEVKNYRAEKKSSIGKLKKKMSSFFFSNEEKSRKSETPRKNELRKKPSNHL